MIGVFDSGSGGLTVLGACALRLPGQDFLYLGDHARAPYGDLACEDIYDHTVEMVGRLFDAGCKLVVVGCNTAAATVLRRLQQEWLPDRGPDRRVLGIHVPMVEALTGAPWTQKGPGPHPPAPRTVAVFATRRTVQAGTYPSEVTLRAPAMTVEQEACPGLVTAIEQGGKQAELKRMVVEHVEAIVERLGAPPDAAVLGCTHYQLVRGLFAEALGPDVQLMSQPDIVARSLAAYLRRHPIINDAGTGQMQLWTTGDPSRVNDALAWLPDDLRSFEAAPPAEPASAPGKAQAAKTGAAKTKPRRPVLSVSVK